MPRLQMMILLALAPIGLLPNSTWATAPTTQPDKTLSASDRLRQAIDASRKLMAEVGQPDPIAFSRVAPEAVVAEDRQKNAGFPRESHVHRHTQIRPWSRHYDPHWWRRLPEGQVPQWPTKADAPALRSLLADQSAELRSLAVEALATLYEPEDVERIGKLLSDEAESAPVLGFNRQMNAAAYPSPPPGPDDLELLRSWHVRTVQTYAREALVLMTGRRFNDTVSFESWWARNSMARECLWYWEQRFQRAMREVEAACISDPTSPPAGIQDCWKRGYTSAQQKIVEELRKAVALGRTPREAGFRAVQSGLLG